MKLSHEACSQVAHLVMGGSAVLVGCGTAGGVPAAIGGTALAALWLNSKRKTGADSRAVLKKVTKVVERDWTRHDDYDFATGLDIKAASDILVAALPEICLTPAEVARTATKHNEAGFPNAATALIVERLLAWCGADGRSERLFEISPKAKLFVETVFNLAFAAAIEDRNYFEQFEPHLLVDIAGYVGDTNRRVVALEDVLREEAEKTRALVVDLESEAKAERAEILRLLRQERSGVDALPEALLAALAERTDASLSLEDQVSDLITRFDAAQELIREGSAPSNLDAFVTSVQKRVADKTLAGDLDGADAEAEDAFAQWERDEAERAEAAQRNGVALIETAIETALARGDAEAVARREMRKIEFTVPEGERFEAARDIRRQYYHRGEGIGSRSDLSIACALAAFYGQTDNREHWAIAKVDLGSVLRILGERGEEGALQDAATVYRAALEVYTRDVAPEAWAITQNNLGNVLSVLGGRDEKRVLQEAITAYRAALEVRTREAAPMQWAITQNNLGNVLRVLGERGEEGALQEAVVAFRAALEVRTRDAAPMDWAMTQNNLGAVLQRLGERGEEGALQHAVAAYRAALEVRTREVVPMQWATTQNNLGDALRVLGERGEEGVLQDAVAAFRAALEVRTRDVAPMDWAMTQENLALLLGVISDRGDDPQARLEAALEAVCGALEVYRDAGATYDIGTAERLEARLREKLAGLEGSS